jgi:hypothetical protein
LDVLAVLLGFLAALMEILVAPMDVLAVLMDVLAVTLDTLLEKRTFDKRIIALSYKPLMVYSTVYNIRKITIIQKLLFAL